MNLIIPNHLLRKHLVLEKMLIIFDTLKKTVRGPVGKVEPDNVNSLLHGISPGLEQCKLWLCVFCENNILTSDA